MIHCRSDEYPIKGSQMSLTNDSVGELNDEGELDDDGIDTGM